MTALIGLAQIQAGQGIVKTMDELELSLIHI